MKKVLLMSAVITLVVVALVVGIGIYKFNYLNNNKKITLTEINNTVQPKQDSKNGTYIIDGAPARYFGNEVTGDLNSDGLPDSAFLLTQDPGGSGTFFYVSVNISTNNGYENLNSILLGDRIAPQTTEIKNGKIIVNYADRNINEPMTTPPSVGVSKYFEVVNNQLIETSAN